VPDIGDAGDVVVIEVAMSEGQQVALDDLLVVLESDKASMEITAEHSGEITSVLVKESQAVEQGTLLARIKTTVETTQAMSPTSRSSDRSSKLSPDRTLDTAPIADASPTSPETPPSTPSKAASSQVYAGPATRRLARELGVDLSQVEGSGQRKRIVKDDVKAFVKNQLTQKASVMGVGLPAVASIDFAKFGEVELVKLSRIRQRGADNLHRSWVNLPHVTQHDEADISDLEDFRKALKSQAEERGVRLTPLAFIVKTVCKALQEHPEFNSSLHDDRQHLVVKNYINIGMAVDTAEGLVVPVIRGADSKDIWRLCEDIASLSEKARTKKLGLDDLSGGTFTISSLGSLGGTGFTPIVNAPEVAILGVAKMAIKPVWRDETFEPRKMLPLSLSYDHRVINGADGGRFMQRLTQLLGDIRHLAL
jgi:pyruvate dehydrogenase E2 component (dihydrolipoamide acetyltransferase)